MENERYARQIMLDEIGEEGQRKLRDSSVLIVGLGGLGSPVATYLTGAGIGRIGLCEPDTVSESNLHRQVIYDTKEIGERKAECALRSLSRISEEIKFEVFDEGLTLENAEVIINQYEIVVDCTDNFSVRYLIDDTCCKLGKTWVHGAIGEFNGLVTVFNGKSGIRYCDLFPKENLTNSKEMPITGVIGPVPGVIGSIQAAEVIKLLVGFGQPLDGKLFTINLLTLSTELIEIL